MCGREIFRVAQVVVVESHVSTSSEEVVIGLSVLYNVVSPSSSARNIVVIRVLETQ